MRWVYIITLLLMTVSCSHPLRKISIEEVSLVETSSAEEMEMEVTLHNSSAQSVTICGAQIGANIKGEPLITFTLLDSLVTLPPSRSTLHSRWRIRRDDPATLYALRRRTLESYIERLTFDVAIQLDSDRNIHLRGVKGKRVAKGFKNMEKFIQQ